MYELLRKVHLFIGLSDTDLEHLYQATEEVRLSAKEELFAEGSAGDSGVYRQRRATGQRVQMNASTRIPFAALLILVVGLSACGQSSSEPVEELTIGVFKGVFSSLIWIAESQGYFALNGLDVMIQDQYETGIAPMRDAIDGKVDIASGAEFVLVSLSFDNKNLKAISTIDLADAIELVARKDHGITQPTDLRGKTIAVPKQTQAEFFLGRFLTFNNLSLDDVDIVGMNPSDLVDAIVAGTIDAAMIWEPNIFTISNKLGNNLTRFPGQSGQEFYFLMVTTDEVITDRPEAIGGFLKALGQAETFIHANPEQAKDIVTNRLDVEEDYVASVWPKNDFVTSLPQSLILAMDDEARWSIANNLTAETVVPNYLDYIYLDGLAALKPNAVTIIR